MDDPRLEEYWNSIWGLLEQGESEAAAAAALRALNEYQDLPELRYLLAVSLLDIDEPEGAIPELEHATRQAPEWSLPHVALAWAFFRVGRFAEAQTAAERALKLDATLAECHQLLGLLAERRNDEAQSLQSFAEARRLDPERFPDPYEMGEDEFLDVAQQVVAELDPELREVLEQTAIFVQPFPETELLRGSDPPLDPQLLGLFMGQSLLEQSVQDSGGLPNTIYLFQRNLERSVSSREELEAEIRITVLHEIGHHLGWNEEELEARGLA